MQRQVPYDQQLLPHLFRTEYTKLIAVLTRLFGLKNIESAEDIASDTFLAAAELWGHKGIPANPTAWLYTVAKNKTLDFLKRDDLFHKKVKKSLLNKTAITENSDIDFSPKHIQDSVLAMMFAVCNPVIPAESQVSLALQILCGFSIEEIANAFLTNKETVKKRLLRAREKLRNESANLDTPGPNEINKRLDNVMTTIYLLFNEGYFSKTGNSIIKKDVCSEAIRLALLLTGAGTTNTPSVNALLALMFFQSSRLDARMNEQGEAVLFEDQDRSLWDQQLIEQGNYYLNLSAQGNKLTRYHLEAGIAYWHTISGNPIEKWNAILQCYNQLLLIEYSPVAALNRAYAYSKVFGNKAAIMEAEKLQMTGNYFYHSLLGEFYTSVEKEEAVGHLQKAKTLTGSVTDRQVLQKRIEKIVSGNH
jgi:RNA polymerase sigma-70 factor (ECF subfamily)